MKGYEGTCYSNKRHATLWTIRRLSRDTLLCRQFVTHMRGETWTRTLGLVRSSGGVLLSTKLEIYYVQAFMPSSSKRKDLIFFFPPAAGTGLLICRPPQTHMLSLAPLALVLLAAAAGGPVRAFPPTVVIFVHGHGDLLFGCFPNDGHGDFLFGCFWSQPATCKAKTVLRFYIFKNPCTSSHT